MVCIHPSPLRTLLLTMGSETIPLHLPKINLSNLQPGSESWDQARTEVRRALETYGCFEAVYTNIPIDLRPATFRALEELFALPAKTKQLNTNHKPFHAYVGQIPQLPLYESMGIDLTEGLEHFTILLWPQGNPTFTETMSSFIARVSELGGTVRRLALESLGVEKYYESHMEYTDYLIRVSKYNAPNTVDVELGLLPHSDKGLLTILCESHDGLQIQTKDGEWFPVETSTDSFIVMACESFLAWTNGRVHAPYHRVMMIGNEDRYSIGLFAMPRAGHIVQAPEELVDEGHPLLFKPFEIQEFLRFFHSEEARQMGAGLKTYCGA